jgi:hypothetical protein
MYRKTRRAAGFANPVEELQVSDATLRYAHGVLAAWKAGTSYE